MQLSYAVKLDLSVSGHVFDPSGPVKCSSSYPCKCVRSVYVRLRLCRLSVVNVSKEALRQDAVKPPFLCVCMWALLIDLKSEEDESFYSL